MTGELDNSVCPTCGGALSSGVATIPFVLGEDKIIVIEGVPAETCADCHEPFIIGKVTDQVLKLLNQLKMLGSEVCVVSFTEYALA